MFFQKYIFYNNFTCAIMITAVIAVIILTAVIILRCVVYKRKYRLLLFIDIVISILCVSYIIGYNRPLYIEFPKPLTDLMEVSELSVYRRNDSGDVYTKTTYELSPEKQNQIHEMFRNTALKRQFKDKNDPNNQKRPDMDYYNRTRLLFSIQLRYYPSIIYVDGIAYKNNNHRMIELSNIYIYKTKKGNYESYIKAETLAPSGKELRYQGYKFADEKATMTLIKLLDLESEL